MPLALEDAARLDADAALAALRTRRSGLGADEAARRLREVGPNAVRSHGARWFGVLARQFINPLLLLLVATALVSIALREHTDAIIILAIVAMSIGVGFVNEFRSERAVEALHGRIRHRAIALRDGQPADVDVTALVPGDVVRLDVGDVVPADVRFIETAGLECDEAILTGEAGGAPKAVRAEPGEEALSTVGYMGTVIRAGRGEAVVVATGGATAFGRIALRLGERLPETAFQQGLRHYSAFLVRVTAVMTAIVFGVNAALRHPLFESLLFALSIAVSLTPQLLPAIVTVALSMGAQRLARRSVVVKRLVTVEDLGNVQVLFTDKTGTLTEGAIAFCDALGPAGGRQRDAMTYGLLCNSALRSGAQTIGGNQLDRALWTAADPAAVAAASDYAKIGERAFDFARRTMAAVVERGGRRTLIVKGAPEAVLAACAGVPPQAQATLASLFAQAFRVIAVGQRDARDEGDLAPEAERGLTLVGFLTFVDPPKRDIAASLARLRSLNIALKIVTGDNPRVAEKLCADVGLERGRTLTGPQIDALSDDALGAAIDETAIFARVSPEQKSRIIRAARHRGLDVGFLGDGVNDAVALHDADVGISVDSATDVAKDAADVVMLEKDLGVLVDSVVEGRRIFSNTIKYVLMGTSSNFGNMFSASGASLVLPFLPALPSQVLLNNLLYDIGEMTIPSDRVDDELLQRPAHWDAKFIRRFMTFFGPINSCFDFLTFAMMLMVFHAGVELFRTGLFVENLLTQSLIIFVIRTRRIPFFRSRPSVPLLATTLATVAVGALLPYTAASAAFGFRPLPAAFFVALVAMIAAYVGLVELGKRIFYGRALAVPPAIAPDARAHRRIDRRAFRWSVPRLPS